MTAAAVETAARPPAFSPRTMLALALVGLVALAGLAVLSAYAPELRSGQDGRAHALSKSAVGYAGLPILLRGLGTPTLVSRARPRTMPKSVVVLTPDVGLSPAELHAYPKGVPTLIVLPKWIAAQDPLRRGFVRKAGPLPDDAEWDTLLKSYAPATRITRRPGRSRPVLRGVGGAFAGGAVLPLGEVDGLKTISGEGWLPALVDERGLTVLAYSRKNPSIWVLADADLMNNQGLKSLDTARAAVTILETARAGDRPVLFDVTLNGLGRERGLWRLMLEPPWLSATLVAAAAALLMGLHALARFGQPRQAGRAFALGARALVDNSADLFRMAKKEHELAPAYAQLSQALVVKAAGGHAPEGWLRDLARRRGVAEPEALAAEAEQAKTRDDLLAVAQKLYEWRGEMTRERR